MTKRFESILRTIEHLGDPVGSVSSDDLLRLAGLLASGLRAEQIGRLCELLRHENAYARIVALRAAARLKAWENGAVLEATIGCISDQDARVRIAAAVVIAGSGYAASRVLDALRLAAGDRKPNDTFDADDLTQQACVEAARAIERLTTKRASPQPH